MFQSKRATSFVHASVGCLCGCVILNARYSVVSYVGVPTSVFTWRFAFPPSQAVRKLFPRLSSFETQSRLIRYLYQMSTQSKISHSPTLPASTKMRDVPQRSKRLDSDQKVSKEELMKADAAVVESCNQQRVRTPAGQSLAVNCQNTDQIAELAERSKTTYLAWAFSSSPLFTIAERCLQKMGLPDALYVGRTVQTHNTTYKHTLTSWILLNCRPCIVRLMSNEL